MAEWKNGYRGSVPDGAFAAGYDHSGPIYSCRAWHEGDHIPGKLVPTLGTAYVPYGGEEHKKDTYEVLCGSGFSWVPCNSQVNLPPNAFEAGKTANGEILYVGRVRHDGVDVCGKVYYTN